MDNAALHACQNELCEAPTTAQFCCGECSVAHGATFAAALSAGVTEARALDATMGDRRLPRATPPMAP